MTFSNTFMYEQCLGWYGMLIEGNPKNYELMVKNRPCTQNVWSVSCPARQSHSYMTPAEGTSSVSNAGIMVPCRTMSSLFAEYGVHHIDFFSLDVEGFEYEVLSTINFNKVHIEIIIAELDKLSDTEDKLQLKSEKNMKVHKLLTEAGFYLVPSKTADLPDCTKTAKGEYLEDLYGSSIYVSQSYRDDICSSSVSHNK